MHAAKGWFSFNKLTLWFTDSKYFGSMHLTTIMTKLDADHKFNTNQCMYLHWGSACIILNRRCSISIFLWWNFRAWAKSLEYNVHNGDFKELWNYWSLLCVQNLCNFMNSLNFVTRMWLAVHLFWKLMLSEFDAKFQYNWHFASSSLSVEFSISQLHS